MNRQILIAALVVGGVLGLADRAPAQFFPGYGYGYGGWGGMDGAAALTGADYRQATAMTLKAQSMQAGQQAAMQQNYVVQSGIRNALSSQAASRDASIVNQQQANQDWFFQQQSAHAVPVRFVPTAEPPPAAMDIIKWPTVLQERCFASERAKIEAPYRRTPPELSVPTGRRLPPDGRHRGGHESRAGVAVEGRCRDRRLQRRCGLSEQIGTGSFRPRQAAGSAN